MSYFFKTVSSGATYLQCAVLIGFWVVGIKIAVQTMRDFMRKDGEQ